MAGISDKSLKMPYVQNKYRYNKKELQNHEFSDGSGLQEYDYGARMQDPQLGRWCVIDQQADKMRKWSPYAYGADDPIKFLDIEGYIIGNPDDPTTKRIQAVLNTTEAGKELWVRMEASTRKIFFHNINIRSKTLSAADKNIALFVKEEKADGQAFSKTGYENAQKGRSTRSNAIGKFNSHTGHYDKTSDWDETHLVILNNGIDANSISDVGTAAAVMKLDLTNDELSDAILLKISSHEGEHAVQDDFDDGAADYDDKTGQYVQDDKASKALGDRDNEKDAENVSNSILAQLLERYMKLHPDLFKPKVETKPDKPNN